MPEGPSALTTTSALGMRERFREMFCNDMSEGSAEKFLDCLGRDQWPRKSYEMCQWRYEHLNGVPSSYVICLQDVTLIPSWQAMFAERLRVKRLLHIDAGHQVMNTRPEALAELLRVEASLRD
jgi:hypothetical protein